MAASHESRLAPTLSVGAGLGALREGFAFVLKRPRLMIMGALPPLITSIFTVLILSTVFLYSTEVATWATPFASGWPDYWRDPFRLAFAFVLSAASVLVMVMVFSALTLTLGAPIYDKISQAVEDDCGGVPNEITYPARVWVPRMLGQTLVTIGQSVLIGIGLFLVGLIPGIGGFISAVLGAVAGGMLITRELVTTPTESRGIATLRERRTFLEKEKAFTLGFGVPVYVLLSIPFVSVAAFPAATAGAAILTRRILRQSVP